MIRKFEGYTPNIHPSCSVSKYAVVTGSVEMGEDSSVWEMATIRGDVDTIKIGTCSNIQEGCILHVDKGFPLEIGNYVTIGHGAKLHGCKIEDGTLIGIGAIVLNGAHIGKNCLVGAGALVTPGTVFEEGMLILGSPAKAKRRLKPDEIEKNWKNAKAYEQLGRRYQNQEQF